MSQTSHPVGLEAEKGTQKPLLLGQGDSVLHPSTSCLLAEGKPGVILKDMDSELQTLSSKLKDMDSELQSSGSKLQL